MPFLAALLVLSNWKAYPLGGVILKLPVAPRTTTNAFGTQMWMAESSDNEIVTVTVSPMPVLDLPVVTLASAAQGAADGYHGRLVEQQDLVANGWPGIDGKIESEGLPTGRIRAYRVKDVLVSVISTMDEMTTNGIFESIAFASRFGKGPLTQAGPVWKRSAVRGLSVVLPDGPSVESDRLTGAYGNRTYVLAVSKDDPEKANEAALKANGGKVFLRDQRILADAASYRLQANALGRTMVFLAESLVLNGKTATLTALVPRALQDSPEVKRFFSSVRPL